MDGEVGGSFRVHLQSLTDFARRLEEQFEVVQRSTRSAAILNRPPDLPLGAFAEAYALSDDHSDAVAQSASALEKVIRSIDFARDVTELVARRYEALDAGGARNIAASVGGLPVSPVPSAPAAVPAPVFPVPAVPSSAVPTVMPPPVTATAAPPSGSLAAPEVLARFVVPVPAAGGTVYYSSGTAAAAANVLVQAEDA